MRFPLTPPPLSLECSPGGTTCRTPRQLRLWGDHQLGDRGAAPLLMLRMRRHRLILLPVPPSSARDEPPPACVVLVRLLLRLRPLLLILMTLERQPLIFLPLLRSKPLDPGPSGDALRAPPPRRASPVLSTPEASAVSPY